MGPREAADDLVARLGSATVAAWGRYAARVGGRLVQDRGLTYVVGTHPTPVIINAAFRTDSSVPPADLLVRSRSFYGALGYDFTVVTTRSGKIMRRVLKAVVLQRDPGDITTIEDEGSVEEARAAVAELRAALDGG